MKIVVLSGKQGSGKSTLQKSLIERWNYTQKAPAFGLNFADILYEMHNEVLAILHKYMEPRPIAKDGPLLQVLGTEWGRKTLGENIWVDLLRYKIDIMGAGHDHSNWLIVVGDCRFKNEFEAFPEALRVRLTAPEEARRARCSMWRENTSHPSETDLDGFEEKFDQTLFTEAVPVEGCVDLIMAQLKKNSWLEKRGKI